MKKLLSLFFVLSLAMQLSAQTETRSLGDYDYIKVSGGISLELNDGEPRAEIEIKKGSLENLITEVKDNTLYIKFEKSGWSWTGKSQEAKIKLFGAQNIEGLKSSAGSSVSSLVAIESEDFSLKVSSGASVELGLETMDAEVSVSSGASAKLLGSAKSIEVSASSGASFNGKNFKCKKGEASASSGATVKLWVTERLEAKASSGGNVKYKGEPEYTNFDVGKYSGGNVSHLN